MNRAKLLRFSTQLATSLVSTRQLGPHSSGLTQVTRFSQLATQFPLFSSIISPQTNLKKFNLDQRLFFSSKSETFVDLISSNDWCEETEIELEKLVPKLTHESIVYGLMKLNENPQKCLDFFKWVSVRKGFDPSYVPYSVLLRSLACKDFVKDFWIVALEMQEKGFFIDNALYLNVLSDLKREKLDKAAEDWSKFYKTLSVVYDGDECAKYVVNLILEFDWNERVKGLLKKELTFPLSENFMLRVLREVWKQPLRAFSFFDWVGSCGGYEHNSVTYNAMLRVLAGSESINEFWDLVGRMKREGFEVDFDTLIKIFRQLPINDSVTLFEMMMDGPYKPSLPECNLLLTTISRESNPDMDLAYRVMNKCVAVGYTLSKKVYDGMHRILCKIGKFDEAKKIVQEMKNAGYEPDNITYSQEIFGLCAQKRFEEACNLLDEMEANGCIPDIKTWTILLRGYCEADQVDEALCSFSKMTGKNVNPDAETLEVLLYGFLSKNKVLGAYKFLVEMVDKCDIKPWQATYKLMIEKLVEVEKLEEAFELLRMMKQQGYPPFPDPIVRYISKSGTVDDAKKVLKALSSKDVPSTAAYVRVIRSFFEQGRESEARDLIYSSPYRVRSQKEIRNMFSPGQSA
ncbi:hypothetical protein RND81_13G137300 [Saponaria officinalis]|uniref:Pentatricopeptide repeat-containing protein n=1 Tax=Saponaria officinalis TaxID=3572 RepID=A0AAW1H336_SAPOF